MIISRIFSNICGEDQRLLDSSGRSLAFQVEPLRLKWSDIPEKGGANCPAAGENSGLNQDDGSDLGHSKRYLNTVETRRRSSASSIGAGAGDKREDE